jgi:PAS domain-containing protein
MRTIVRNGETDGESRPDQVTARDRWYREVLDALSVAIYATDANGRVIYFNEAAAAFAGRRPKLGEDEWCVTWRLYWPDGRPMPHDQCPMAVALR